MYAGVRAAIEGAEALDGHRQGQGARSVTGNLGDGDMKTDG